MKNKYLLYPALVAMILSAANAKAQPDIPRKDVTKLLSVTNYPQVPGGGLVVDNSPKGQLLKIDLKNSNYLCTATLSGTDVWVTNAQFNQLLDNNVAPVKKFAIQKVVYK